MIYSVYEAIQSVYKTHFEQRLCIYIGKDIKKRVEGSLYSTSLEEIIERYSILCSSYSHNKPIVIFYHAFSMWDRAVQEQCMEWLTFHSIDYIAVDYTLAERTLEWVCGYIKYMIEFRNISSLHRFLTCGGLYGLLYRYAVTVTQNIRFPLTQELLIVQKHERNEEHTPSL